MSVLEHFSLRWNNFHANMSAGFCALLQEDALVDVTLAAEGRFLQAHRLVLSVCSPYFKQLFAANPCKHPIVILKDVHHKQMSDLLNFMYQGEVNVKQEDLATFLRTAELLQIKGLTGQDPYSDQQQDSDHRNREEQQHTAVSGEHMPNIGPRQRAVRRPRQQEKHAALSALISSSVDSHLSPTPSPPPVKRIKPSASEPIILTPDDDLRDEISKRGSECESRAKEIKLEPPSDFDSESFNSHSTSHNEENATHTSANDSVLRKALTPQSSQSRPISPLGGSQETEEPNKHKLSRRPPQFLQPEGPAAAGSSGVTVPTTEGSSSSSNDQGSLVPQYVHSRKGGLQLVLEGFLYTVHQQQGRNKYWRCVERGKLGCQGYCKTFMQEEGEVVRQLRSHNHGRQDDKIQERVNATRLRLQVLHALSQQQGAMPNFFYAAPNGNTCGSTLPSLKTK